MTDEQYKRDLREALGLDATFDGDWADLLDQVRTNARRSDQLKVREMQQRETLPGTRDAITRRFELPYKLDDGTVTTMKIYFTLGKYPNGQPGEIFIKADRSGSLPSGALDAVAQMMSLGLQYGIPLSVLTGKLRHSRFEPQGMTKDPQIRSASSPLDLLAQWLDSVYPPS